MTKLEKIKLLLKLTATDITAPENSETLRDKINNAVDHMLASKILPIVTGKQIGRAHV